MNPFQSHILCESFYIISSLCDKTNQLFLPAHRSTCYSSEEEDDQEEIFADIRVVKRQAKQLERRAELEFGKVKYSKRPRQTEPTGNACLYGNVHKAM